MKSFSLALSVIMMSQMAFGGTFSVEFKYCSNNSNYICADVYLAQAGGGNRAEEMGINIDHAPELGSQINQLIIRRIGRSLMINVQGSIQTVQKMFGGTYKKLRIDSLDGTNSDDERPRNFDAGASTKVNPAPVTIRFDRRYYNNSQGHSFAAEEYAKAIGWRSSKSGMTVYDNAGNVYQFSTLSGIDGLLTWVGKVNPCEISLLESPPDYAPD
jgi:hypothetical protein